MPHSLRTGFARYVGTGGCNSSSACPALHAGQIPRRRQTGTSVPLVRTPPRAPARIQARVGRPPATAANSRRSASRDRDLSADDGRTCCAGSYLPRASSDLATRHGISRPSLRGLPIKQSITSSGAEQSSESAATSSSYLCCFANSTRAISWSAPRRCFSSTTSRARVKALAQPIAAGERIGRSGEDDGLTVMMATGWRARWPADEVATLDRTFAALLRDAMRAPVEIRNHNPVPTLGGRDLSWCLWSIGAAGSGAVLPLLRIAEELPGRAYWSSARARVSIL